MNISEHRQKKYLVFFGALLIIALVFCVYLPKAQLGEQEYDQHPSSIGIGSSTGTKADCLPQERKITQNLTSVEMMHLANAKYPKIRRETYEIVSEDGEVYQREAKMVANHLVVRHDMSEKHWSNQLPAGFRVIHQNRQSSFHLVAFDDNIINVRDAAKALNAVGYFAEPDYLVEISSMPDDPKYPQQWAMKNTGQTGGTAGVDIRAEEAWDLGTGSSSIKIAILDSGIDLSHPDLIDNIWMNPGESGGGKENNGVDDDGNGYVDDWQGWDFTSSGSGDNSPDDENGHGTHVAGIIGATGNNQIGVAGVCHDSSLMVLKVFGPSGVGYVSDVVDAMAYANLMGASVANHSYRTTEFSANLKTAFTSYNGLSVCASGNAVIGEPAFALDNDRYPVYPACFESANILTVTASDANGSWHPQTRFGKRTCHIAAPGTEIYSTALGGAYETRTGSSMACAFVSGAAALGKSLNTQLSPLGLSNLILSNSLPFTDLSGRCVTGSGLKLYGVADASFQQRNLSKLAGGSDHFLQITPEGKVAAWGANDAGQCGILSSGADVLLPTFVPGMNNAIEVAAARKISCCLRSDGSVWVWGGVYATPTQMLNISNGVHIACNNNNIAVLKANGTVDVYSIASGNYIATILGLSNVSSIAAGRITPEFAFLTSTTTAGSNLLYWKPGDASATQVSAVQLRAVCISEKPDGYPHEGRILGASASPNQVIRSSAYAFSSSYQTLNLSNGGGPFVSIKPLMMRSQGILSEGFVLGNGFTSNVTYLNPSIPNGQPYPTYIIPNSANTIAIASADSAAVIMDKNGNTSTFGNMQSGLSGIGTASYYTRPVKIERIQNIARFDESDGIGAITNSNGVIEWGNNANPSFMGMPSSIQSVLISGSGLVTQKTRDVIIRGGAVYVANSSTSINNPYSVLARSFGSVTGGFTNATSFATSVVSADLAIDGMINNFPTVSSNKTKALFAVKADGAVIRSNFVSYSSSISGSSTISGIPLCNKVAVCRYRITTPPFSNEVNHYAVFFLTRDGRVYRLGNSSIGGNTTTPLEISGLSNVKNITCDGYAGANMDYDNSGQFLLIEKNDNTFWFMGQHDAMFGGVAQNTPVQVPELTGVKKVSIGAGFALALKQDGTVMAWGKNNLGQLGVNHTNDVTLANAQLVFGIGDASDVDAQPQSGLVIRSDGSVWGWGSVKDANIPTNGAGSATPIKTLSNGISPTLFISGGAFADWMTSVFTEEELRDQELSAHAADPESAMNQALLDYIAANEDEPGAEVAAVDQEVEVVAIEEEAQTQSEGGDDPPTLTLGAKHLQYTLRRHVKRSDIQYCVEVSSDMENWSSGPEHTVTLLDTTTTLRVLDLTPISADSRRFMRLTVTLREPGFNE